MSRSAQTDPRGGFHRLYHELVSSNAWRALSHAEVRLYVALARRLNGSNNGAIEATIGSLRCDGITSESMLARSLRSLKTLGIIATTRQGQLSQGLRVKSMFRFTELPVYDMPKHDIKAMPATRDWLAFKTLAAAQAALQAAHIAAKRPPKNDVPPLSQKCSHSLAEAAGPITNSVAEGGKAVPTLSQKAVRMGVNRPQTLASTGFAEVANRKSEASHQLLPQRSSIDIPGCAPVADAAAADRRATRRPQFPCMRASRHGGAAPSARVKA